MTTTPILCTTRDEQGAVAVTVATMYAALYCLRRTPTYVQIGALGYAKSRTLLFRDAYQRYQSAYVRGFLIDDDIRLADQKALEQVIRTADANRWNVVAPYRGKSGRFSIIKKIPPRPSGTSTEMITEDELVKIKPYDEVELAGLGFYYGDIPLQYEFHEGNPYTGEDLNFFHDNALHIRLAPLYLEHLKSMPLPGAKYE
jgi:hypothetical protein